MTENVAVFDLPAWIDEQGLITIKEAAAAHDVTERTVRRWIEREWIQVWQPFPRGPRYVYRQEVIDFEPPVRGWPAGTSRCPECLSPLEPGHRCESDQRDRVLAGRQRRRQVLQARSVPKGLRLVWKRVEDGPPDIWMTEHIHPEENQPIRGEATYEIDAANLDRWSLRMQVPSLDDAWLTVAGDYEDLLDVENGFWRFLGHLYG